MLKKVLSEEKQPTRPIMSVEIKPPDLKDAKNYECFKKELLLWQSLTSLEPTEQAWCVALNLPNDCPFAENIGTKVMEWLSMEELQGANGMEKLVSLLDKEVIIQGVESGEKKGEIINQGVEPGRNYKPGSGTWQYSCRNHKPGSGTW